MQDIVIIGGGPAGLAAAIYVQRAGKHAVVLEANVCGGQILSANKVENYPGFESVSGAELALKMQKQAESLGAEIRFVRATGITNKKTKRIVHTPEGNIEAKAVIIATGASHKSLGLQNEKSLVGCGVSYCATCDGAFFKNKVVAVVGGGNTALQDALFLSAFASQVFLIHRRDQFRGEQKYVDELKTKNNVQFILNTNVTKLFGEKKLEKIEITKNNGTNQTLEISGLFLAVGQVPGNEDFADIVELDNNGYIVAGEDCHTKEKGIYVAGDTRTKKVRQLTTATADGTIAAIAACSEMF